MIGVVVWFTGRPSSGKSTLARRVATELRRGGRVCCVLDGDRIRSALTPSPGYSMAERGDFYTTLTNLAVELSTQGLVVLVAATAHLREFRDRARIAAPAFIEVYVDVEAAECVRRDTKHLYAKARTGTVQSLPGSAGTAYQQPPNPEVTAYGGFDARAIETTVAAIVRAAANRQSGGAMLHKNLTVSDVMCTDLVLVNPTETLSQADADMKLSDIRHLPVVDDDNQLCGILSDRDIYKALAAPARGELLVSDVMTQNVMTVGPESPIREATALMLDHKIGATPVVGGDGQLVGLITETDILRMAHNMLGGDVMAVPEQ